MLAWARIWSFMAESTSCPEKRPDRGSFSNVQRVKCENVMMRDGIVPGRAGAVVSIVVAFHFPVAGKPCRVIVDALSGTMQCFRAVLPLAVILLEYSPSEMDVTVGGKSIRTQ